MPGMRARVAPSGRVGHTTGSRQRAYGGRRGFNIAAAASRSETFIVWRHLDKICQTIEGVGPISSQLVPWRIVCFQTV